MAKKKETTSAAYRQFKKDLAEGTTAPLYIFQ